MLGKQCKIKLWISLYFKWKGDITDYHKIQSSFWQNKKTACYLLWEYPNLWVYLGEFHTLMCQALRERRHDMQKSPKLLISCHCTSCRSPQGRNFQKQMVNCHQKSSSIIMFEGTRPRINGCNSLEFCSAPRCMLQWIVSCRIPLQQQPFVLVTKGRNQLQMLHQHHHNFRGGTAFCLSLVFVKYE